VIISEGTAPNMGAALRRWVPVARRRLGIFLLPVVLFTVLGYVAYRHIPARYDAQAVLALDARQFQGLPSESVISPLPQESPVLRTELDIIQSRMMAQRVVDRLMRRGGGHVPLVPVFDTRAAIAGAGVETDAGGVRLRLQLEAASAPLELACSIVLVGDDDRRLRLDQPASVTVDEPRLLTLEVVVPDGVLDDGRYRGTIFASVDGPGGRSLLFRRDLLRFDVGTGPGDDEEDALFEAFDPTEFASAVGVERMGDLEWNVVAG